MSSDTPLGSLPDHISILHSVKYPAPGFDHAPQQASDASFDSERHVTFFKTFNAQTNTLEVRGFDADGTSIDRSAYEDAEQRARFEKYGGVDRYLSELLAEKAPDDTVNIVVWPCIDASKLTSIGTPADSAAATATVAGSSGAAAAAGDDDPEAPFRRHVAQVKAAAADALRRFNATVRSAAEPDSARSGTDDDVPYIKATIAAKDVKALAGADSVGGVFYDDEQRVDNLARSLANAGANSNVVQDIQAAVPINPNTPVNVAVWEEGPLDLGPFVIQGRYRHELRAVTAWHAEHVIGIIKHRDNNGLQGYAPNCHMWLANSYADSALWWALGRSGGPNRAEPCTVISSSFYYATQRANAELDSNDIFLDFCTWLRPYPLIIKAAGNAAPLGYVCPKGFNTMSVGSHDEAAMAMAVDSSWRNPRSLLGDRELPCICAQGENVALLNRIMSGTSFAAPAVAGTAALVQSVRNGALKGRPEVCRAILYASAALRSVSNHAWADDVRARIDRREGAGRLSALAACLTANNGPSAPNAAAVRGWAEINPVVGGQLGRLNEGFVINATKDVCFGAAIAWRSTVTTVNGRLSSYLVHDLDIYILDPDGHNVAWSASFDNSYEVVTFKAQKTGNYRLIINMSRWKDTKNPTCVGVAWSCF